MIQAPLYALKYVMADELSHLVDRHHGEAFWLTLAPALPEWRMGPAALERWETGRRSL